MADATIVTELSARIDKLEQALGRASAEIKSFHTNTQRENAKASSSFSSLSKDITKAFSVVAIAQFGQRVINLADEIGDLADRTGFSTESVQSLGLVAQRAGTDISSLSVVMQRVDKTLQDALTGSKSAKKSFDDLGISLVKFAGMNADERFDALAKAIKENGKTAAGSAAAYDLLEKQAHRLGPVFAQIAGAGGLGAFNDSMKKSGQIIDEEARKSLEKLQNDLEKGRQFLTIFGAKTLSIASDVVKTVSVTLAGVVSIFKDGWKAAIDATADAYNEIWGNTKDGGKKTQEEIDKANLARLEKEQAAIDAIAKKRDEANKAALEAEKKYFEARGQQQETKAREEVKRLDDELSEIERLLKKTEKEAKDLWDKILNPDSEADKKTEKKQKVREENLKRNLDALLKAQQDAYEKYRKLGYDSASAEQAAGRDISFGKSKQQLALLEYAAKLKEEQDLKDKKSTVQYQKDAIERQLLLDADIKKQEKINELLEEANKKRADAVKLTQELVAAQGAVGVGNGAGVSGIGGGGETVTGGGGGDVNLSISGTGGEGGGTAGGNVTINAGGEGGGTAGGTININGGTDGNFTGVDANVLKSIDKNLATLAALKGIIYA